MMDTTALLARSKATSALCASTPRLTLSGISKSFPGVRALHDVGLSLYPGQVTALIGENGAGKSTLVKILTGIYQPDAGKIRIDGEAVDAVRARTPRSSRHHRDPPGNGAVRRSVGRREHLSRPRAAHPLRH